MKNVMSVCAIMMIIAIGACTNHNGTATKSNIKTDTISAPLIVNNQIHNNAANTSVGGLFIRSNVIMENNTISYPLYGDFMTNAWRNDCMKISEDVQYMTKADYIRGQNIISQ
jgi:hypothetical protein